MHRQPPTATTPILHGRVEERGPGERPGGCAHCGLPVPREGDAFCCAGCEAVHRILRDEGLEAFYRYGGGAGQPIGAVPNASPPDWIEDVAAQAVVAPDLAVATLDVQGIRCAACVWVLQELWRRQDGALRIDLNPSLGRARLTWDPRALDFGAFAVAVARLGYRLGPERRRDEDSGRGLLVRLGICSALALNAMMFAAAGYFGLSAADGAIHELFRWLSAAMALAAVAVGGPVFFRAAWHGLRTRVLHLDLPISLGIVLAFGGSAVEFGLGGGASYFDTVTVFVALMLAGRFVQERALRRNRDYLLADSGIEHLRARRLREGRVERVAVTECASGDTLLLAPGDLLPADARLAAPAAFALDWISGESETRAFAAGAEVPAGAFLAGDAPVTAVVAKTARESGLVGLIGGPAIDRDERGTPSAFWPRLNRFYVVAVLLLAASGAALWSVLDPSRIVAVTTSLLVVTCPCAIGLALPLAVELALGRLRRRGVFVRTRTLLDKALRVRRVVFDKTGTLTWGGLIAYEELAPPAEDLAVLATLTAASNHPVCRALAELHGDERLIDGAELREVAGEGVEARWRGATWRLGRASFAVPAAGVDDGACWLTRDGEPRARWRFDEDYRPGARDEITALRARGHEVWLLSGDRREKVARAALVLGLPADRALGELRPHEKAELIAALDDDDTLMVGDGVNDAPAFDAAFCAGTPAVDRPVMPARADFYYTGNGSGVVRAVLDTARRFRAVVVTDLWLAAAYNAAVVAAALAGAMTPVLCAVVMPLSSVALLGHTMLRLRGGAR